MKYAIVNINGNQYKVSEGEEFEAGKVEGEKGKKLIFTDVLLVVDKEKVSVGQPLVNKTKVTAEIIDQLKGKKIRVATYKAKVRYRRTRGHRPWLTKIKIGRITASG